MEKISDSSEIRDSNELEELSSLIYSENNLKSLKENFYQNRLRRILEAKERIGVDSVDLNEFFVRLKEVGSKFFSEMDIKDQEDILKNEEPNIRGINAKLFELGIVKIADTMEYKVNRRNSEVAENMGIESFPALELALIEFYERNGILKDESSSGKLISMSWGCGNAGGLLERRLQKENIGQQNKDLSKYYEYFGCADSIYSSLDDLMYKFIKPEYKNKKKSVYRDFISILATLILRAHRLANFEDEKVNFSGEPTSKKMFSFDTRRKLKNIIKDVNCLREIFYSLDECRIIKSSWFKNEKKQYPVDLEYSSEKMMDIKNKSVVALFNELTSCYFDESGNKHDDFASRVSLFINKYFDESFLDKEVNLNKYHEIHSHNVFLMDFQDAPEIFGQSTIDKSSPNNAEKPLMFHLVTAFRSNSHQKRDNYLKSLGTLFEHLVPGGIILDDGDRESYTREEVLDELIGIQRDNPDMKIDVITKKSGKKLSLLIQKGLKIGDNIFFLNADEQRKFVSEKRQVLSIEDYKNKKIIQNFRSMIVYILKEIQINGSPIKNSYFLKTNFFRTLNNTIDDKIIDFILQELVRYSVSYLLKEKSALDNLNMTNQQLENVDKLSNINECLNLLLPSGNTELREEVISKVLEEQDFAVDYLIENINIPKIKKSKDKNIRLKKMIFETILDSFKNKEIDISSQVIFDYIDQNNRQNHLISVVEKSPEIQHRIAMAEYFIAKHPFVVAK